MNNNKLSNILKNLENTHDEYILKADDTFEKNKANFKKYEKPIINSINQTAGGTKPRVVGQMSELVPTFVDECINSNVEINPENWKKWYLDKHSENYKTAIKKATEMAKNYKKVMDLINEDNISKWMDNFLFIENIEGLLIQDEIMRFIKNKYPSYSIRAAKPSEESKNIDIVINNRTYQVKPTTQKQGTSYNQKWGEEEAIWYRKAIKDKKAVYKFYLPKSLK